MLFCCYYGVLLFVLLCYYFCCPMYLLCVLYHCHRLLTQLQLTNISISVNKGTKLFTVTRGSHLLQRSQILSSGMWEHEIWQKHVDVSEERATPLTKMKASGSFKAMQISTRLRDVTPQMTARSSPLPVRVCACCDGTQTPRGAARCDQGAGSTQDSGRCPSCGW